MSSVPDTEITEPAIIVRITKSYREGMPALDLYEATRGVWRMGEKRRRARFALSAHRGVVKEVYEIHEWHHGDTTPYSTRSFDDPRRHERWEFTGTVASERVREKYLGKSVAHYARRGAQSPIIYVNIE